MFKHLLETTEQKDHALQTIKTLIEVIERACEHSVPDDCYSTGPLTGNPIADLVICPGCVALNEAAEARKEYLNGA